MSHITRKLWMNNRLTRDGTALCEKYNLVFLQLLRFLELNVKLYVIGSVKIKIFEAAVTRTHQCFITLAKSSVISSNLVCHFIFTWKGINKLPSSCAPSLFFFCFLKAGWLRDSACFLWSLSTINVPVCVWHVACGDSSSASTLRNCSLCKARCCLDWWGL